MRNVFLFPGQGAQKKGMLLDICRKFPQAMAVVKEAEKVSGQEISKYMWEIEDAELARSDRSQLAIITGEIALIKALEAKGITADLCAGFSLGEFAALYCSGVLTFEETIKLVSERGIIMQKLCDKIALESGGKQPGMAAVIGLSPEEIIKAIEPLSKEGLAYGANLNSPKQTVISASFEGLEKAKELCSQAGCRRFIPLKVAGPFHSPFMEEAGQEFAERLEKLEFKNPEKKLFSNVTGKEVTSGLEAKKLAVKHFTNPVHWTSEEAEIGKIIGYENSDCINNWNIFEVGPGTVLSGLWRDSGYAENISCKVVNLEMLEK